MIRKNNTNRGLIKGIIIFFVVLLILAYFGFNIRTIVASETFQSNWAFVKDSSIYVWEHILKTPVMFIWDSVFIPYIWDPIVGNISNR